jgi:hypothetical protein
MLRALKAAGQVYEMRYYEGRRNLLKLLQRLLVLPCPNICPEMPGPVRKMDLWRPLSAFRQSPPRDGRVAKDKRMRGMARSILRIKRNGIVR